MRGVFDVEELPDVLRKENCKDVCVLRMPEGAFHYEYLILVTVKSKLHLWALTEFLRKLYKRKRSRKDPIPIVVEKDKKAADKANINWISLIYTEM